MEKKSFAVVGRQIVFYHTKQEDRPILDSLDINIRKGHIYGLLGPSGCGKTTFLRCILGRLQLKSGYIWVYGRRPGEPNFFIPGKGVGYMPQEIALCSTITVEEILWHFGQLYRMDYRHIERRIAFLVDLLNIPSKDILVYNLSEGQKRRVSFAAALIHDPPLLILDEPTVGVDPVLRQTIWNYLNLIAYKTDTTVIITTHYVEEARNAHKVGLMGNGRLLVEKDPAKLIKMHQARTLEDVFLKLTIANDEWSDVSSAMEKTSSTKVDKSYHASSLAETSELLRDESERDYSPDFSKVSEKSSLKKHADLGALKDNGNPVNAYGTYSPAQKFVNSLSRIGTLIKKSFIESRRNIPLLIFRISICTIQLIMYSIAIQSFSNVPLAVVNANSENIYSGKFLEKLDAFTQISYCNLSSAKGSVRLGKTKGVLYIQPNFMPNTKDRLFRQSVSNYTHENDTASGSPIQLFLDMSDQQLSSAIKSKVENGLNDFMEDELKIGEQYSPIVVGKAIYGSRDVTYRDFVIINLLTGLLYYVGVSLTAVSIVAERKEGFIERLMVAGVTYFEILVSILFSMMIIMALQVALSVMSIAYIIQIPIHGSVLWLSIVSLFAGVCSLILGLLFATTSDNEFMALLITLSINSPISIFSGILWHKASMSKVLKSISYLFPITTLAENSNDIVSRGWSLMEHQTFWKILVPFGWIVFPLWLAMVIDKYKNR